MTDRVHRLDARGLNCPLPILRTKKAIAAMASGEVLQVTATDPGSLKDLQSFCGQTGHVMLAADAANGEFVFRIRKA